MTSEKTGVRFIPYKSVIGSAMFTPGRLPQLVVFDLDYTCWDLYCDTHVSPPIKRKDDREINLVYDRYNTPMSFYPELPDILVELHNKDVKLALASRTSAIKCANQALTELLVPAPVALRQRQKVAADGELVSAIRLFDPIEIYVGESTKSCTAPYPFLRN